MVTLQLPGCKGTCSLALAVVALDRNDPYGRPMTVIRRTTSESQPSENVNRLARFVGRMLLWGCVLLLLVRGVASYLSTGSHVVTTSRGAGVTVTQPASAAPSSAEGK